MTVVPQNIALPKNGRRIAIGDIHGCYYTFKNLLENEIKIEKGDQLFLLGDYINRGNNSAKVLDYILILISEGFSIFPLRGNHEQKFLQAFELGWDYFEDFLLSYGSIDLFNEEVDKYIGFCSNLSYAYYSKGFFLSHCGISPFENSIVTDIRTMFSEINLQLDQKILKESKFVHGHIEKPFFEIEDAIQKRSKNLNIDAGCVYFDNPVFGYLLGLDLDQFKLYKQKNIDLK